MSVALDRLATSDNEVDLVVSLLECTIGVAPFGWWRRRPLLPVIVLSIVVVLVMSIVASVAVIIVTVVVASVITAVVAVIITSIPIIIARIGPAVSIISSIRSSVTIVEALATVAIIVVVASGLLGGRRNSKSMLQLLALPHGALGVTVELALVVHDHIEVTFEEGGRSWWIYYISFTRSFA
jgi:hypothetical protein